MFLEFNTHPHTYHPPTHTHTHTHTHAHSHTTHIHILTNSLTYSLTHTPHPFLLLSVTGGPYECFSGKDASRGLATMNMAVYMYMCVCVSLLLLLLLLLTPVLFLILLSLFLSPHNARPQGADNWDNLEGLKPSELTTMYEWEAKFMGKYIYRFGCIRSNTRLLTPHFFFFFGTLVFSPPFFFCLLMISFFSVCFFFSPVQRQTYQGRRQGHCACTDTSNSVNGYSFVCMGVCVCVSVCL